MQNPFHRKRTSLKQTREYMFTISRSTSGEGECVVSLRPTKRYAITQKGLSEGAPPHLTHPTCGASLSTVKIGNHYPPSYKTTVPSKGIIFIQLRFLLSDILVLKRMTRPGCQAKGHRHSQSEKHVSRSNQICLSCLANSRPSYQSSSFPNPPTKLSANPQAPRRRNKRKHNSNANP